MSLRTKDPEIIIDLYGQLKREAGHLVDEVIELSYFMRGAIDYESMLRRTFHERRRIGSFIKKRMESESKRMYPNY